MRTTVRVTLPPTSAMTLPPLNTWYMATPTLSVDGSQASSMEVGWVCPIWCRFAGGVGGSVSTGPITP